MSATTSSLAFEAMEGEEQTFEIVDRLSLRSPFTHRRKAAVMAVEDVFHMSQATDIDRVVCISGKMTVSF